MLGKRGPQRGLFEADTAYGAFVGRDSFYGWLASQRGELFRDEQFAGLYVLDNGRPSVPPSLLAVALVLQTYDGVSDEEANTGCAVEETLGDCAYGSGETRQAFAEADRTIVAKVPSPSNQGCFPKTAFVLDLAASSATCPAGQTTQDFTPSPTGGGQFRFAASVCAACPLR